jgi:translocator assembly and maintenance protein 41
LILIGQMIDIVFVVDDPVGWHRENLRRNWRHYSILKYFGPKVIAKIQEEFASGVYYNPFVWVDKQVSKQAVGDWGS